MAASPSKTILICDNDPRVRQALKALLLTRSTSWGGGLSSAIQVAGEACQWPEVLQIMAALQPEIVLMDASIPGINGIEATRLIKRKWPKTKVVMLAMHPGTRVAALAAGVDTFLLKGCPAETLFEAILGQSY
ncbi:MAG: response regulator transcription factor [Anaerolineaceae bacterium]|nr:response regulator transcription factor [Anaerolineaceae bacterium]